MIPGTTRTCYEYLDVDVLALCMLQFHRPFYLSKYYVIFVLPELEALTLDMELLRKEIALR